MIRQERISSSSPVSKMRSLIDIYESCNFTVVKPKSYKATSKEEVWVKAMKEEIKMIEKNKTWELMD
jgi:hypothetical protein